MGTPQSEKRTNESGAFVRQESSFRSQVTADGSSQFPAEAGRYHLYISLACPWASRAHIVSRLKGLEDAISMSVVDPFREVGKWRFTAEYPDPVNGFELLDDAYRLSDPDFDDLATVPLLWDKQENRAVNNESSEIIRMLNLEFNEFAAKPELDLYPEELREEIDSINERVYRSINDGVALCGYATTQSAYEEAFVDLFEALDLFDDLLGKRRYLAGDRLTEADWRLFVTLVRFDVVFVGHFKCNQRQIADYENLSGYLRELYQHPGIRETVDFDHIKRHYYTSQVTINPTQIVPAGPLVDLDSVPGRDHL